MKSKGKRTLLADLAGNIVAEIMESGNARHLFRLYLEAEITLHNHHNVYKVETVYAKVVLELGTVGYLLFVYLQVVNEKRPYFLFYPCSCQYTLYFYYELRIFTVYFCFHILALP